MRTVGCLLLPLVLAVAGCLELPTKWHDGPAQPEPPTPIPAAQPPKLVVPNQVTEANARAIAEALDQEISGDQTSDPLMPPATRPDGP
jgi:hypothetical protein